MYDKTMTFSLENDRELDLKNTLTAVYDALLEKGYNPISQIAGYIVSGDPTYITTHGGARSLMKKIDRFELLQHLIKKKNPQIALI